MKMLICTILHIIYFCNQKLFHQDISYSNTVAFIQHRFRRCLLLENYYLRIFCHEYISIS